MPCTVTSLSSSITLGSTPTGTGVPCHMLYLTTYNARVKGSMATTGAPTSLSLRSVLWTLKATLATLVPVTSTRLVTGTRTSTG